MGLDTQARCLVIRSPLYYVFNRFHDSRKLPIFAMAQISRIRQKLLGVSVAKLVALWLAVLKDSGLNLVTDKNFSRLFCVCGGRYGVCTITTICAVTRFTKL